LKSIKQLHLRRRQLMLKLDRRLGYDAALDVRNLEGTP
jgi:hypothetical protein